MTVFEFKVFFDVTDDKAQRRYVVAETEEAAWEKINAHFEKMANDGFMKPCCICDPTVEVDYVIA